jgi:peptidoglycan/xylan/chitin deacetylase (PgdA/CDA1 family)
MRRPVTLVYHAVGPVEDRDDPSQLVLSPRRLESQLRLLVRLRYRFLTAEELAAAGRPEPGTAVLTFDDGYRSWLDHVVPLLQRLGVKASFYVSPGLFGGHKPEIRGEAGRLLDQEGAQTLHEAGMELGAHSLTHPDLRGLDDTALERELTGSKAAVEAITGRPCRTFAYPFGLHDERVRDAVGAAGFELAFAWMPGRWHPLAAPRLPAPPRHGALKLAAKLVGIRRRRPAPRAVQGPTSA